MVDKQRSRPLGGDRTGVRGLTAENAETAGDAGVEALTHRGTKDLFADQKPVPL